MKITKREGLKSVFIAALAGVITVVITSLNAGQFPSWTEIKPALFAALATLLSALLKYVGTDTITEASKDIQAAITTKDQVKVTKENIVKEVK